MCIKETGLEVEGLGFKPGTLYGTQASPVAEPLCLPFMKHFEGPSRFWVVLFLVFILSVSLTFQFGHSSDDSCYKVKASMQNDGEKAEATNDCTETVMLKHWGTKHGTGGFLLKR